MNIIKKTVRNLLPIILLAGMTVAAPARAVLLYGLTNRNTVISFDSLTPGKLRSAYPVSGLQPNETLLGMDLRPAIGRIYALGSTGRLYLLDPETGLAAQGPLLAADPTDLTEPFTALNGVDFGVDFNPMADRLRVVSNTGQNLRINPADGLVTTDGAISPGTPTLAASAYTSNYNGTNATVLYGINAAGNNLVIQNPPNNGTIVNVGPLGVDVSSAVNLDILGGRNVAYAAMSTQADPNVSRLYTVSLATGQALQVGVIGPPGSNLVLRGLTAATGNAHAVTTQNTLINFETTTPGIVSFPFPITGLLLNETLLGIDVRTSSGQLYGLGSSGLLYTLNPLTGVATPSIALTADPSDTSQPYTGLNGERFGMDFDPVTDRLRVVSDAKQNLRVNVDTGTVITDFDLNPGAPTVGAAAYSDNFIGSAGTTLYVIDSSGDILSTLDPPNNGTMKRVGALDPTPPTPDFNGIGGFDIAGLAGYAALNLNGVVPTQLFSVNLSTGAATLIGDIGLPIDTFTVSGLAVTERPFKGDVDGNNTVNVQDAIRILRHVVGLETLSLYEQRLADVNNSGTVTVEDAVFVLRRVVGLA